MARRTVPPVYICGGDDHPGPRDDCPNALHDYPLPNGYGDAHEVAERRLRRRWVNPRCPDCGLYGWRPGLRDLDTPRTPHTTTEPEENPVGDTRLPEAIDAVARQVLQDMAAEDLGVLWEDYPEVGEQDWLDVVERLRGLVASLGIIAADPAGTYAGAYEFLADRAKGQEA